MREEVFVGVRAHKIMLREVEVARRKFICLVNDPERPGVSLRDAQGLSGLK